jgi:tetratricopeptide (TPR) repeat protein
VSLEVRLPEPLQSERPGSPGIHPEGAPPSLTISISHYPAGLPSQSSHLFLEAKRFADRGDWTNAVERYRALTKAVPDAISYYLLGIASHQAGDIDAAISAFRKAIKVAGVGIRTGKRTPPETVTAVHFALGAIFLGLGRADEALREMRAVVRLDSEHEDAFFALGSIQCKRGQWEPAIQAFENAIRIKNDFAEAYLRLAKLYAHLGEAEGQDEYFSKAIETYRRLVDIFPRTSAAYNDIGVLLIRIGDKQAAIGAFEKALQVNPSNVLALTNLGTAYLAEERFEEASRTFEKAVQTIETNPPKDRDVPDILARQYVGSGVALVGLYRAQSPKSKDSAMLREAESAYAKAIEADPGNAIAHSNLAAVYSELGQTEAAEREMLRAIQLDPEDQIARAAFDSMMANRYSQAVEDQTQDQRIRDSLRLLSSLLEGDDQEQRETFAFLKQALEEDKLSNRRRFTE